MSASGRRIEWISVECRCSDSDSERRFRLVVACKGGATCKDRLSSEKYALKHSCAHAAVAPVSMGSRVMSAPSESASASEREIKAKDSSTKSNDERRRTADPAVAATVAESTRWSPRWLPLLLCVRAESGGEVFAGVAETIGTVGGDTEVDPGTVATGADVVQAAAKEFKEE